jgi:hypothetical protein
MKTYLLIIPLIIFNTINIVFAQSYTTESKSCGSCSMPVSVNSRVGMRCPHCGVRWGYENSKTTTSTIPDYSTDTYDFEKKSGFTSSRVNLRAGPSTKSRIVKVLPAFTFVDIKWKTGQWYYVNVSEYNGIYNQEYSGYIHRKLLD